MTWNPLAAFDVLTGKRGWFCTKISPGCAHCYAELFNLRLGNLHPYVRTHEEKVEWRLVNLLDALGWRKPQRVFVNSMTDLFHEAVPDRLIRVVFAAMAIADQHTFMVLTKRAKRMREFFALNSFNDCFIEVLDWLELDGVYGQDVRPWEVELKEDLKRIAASFRLADQAGRLPKEWPLPNVWLGATVEDQVRADERVPELVKTPAAVRFLSCEPLLGPVDLTPPLLRNTRVNQDEWLQDLDWIIVGGESGPKARPMHPHWARAIRNRCQGRTDMGRPWHLPFFFKQWGEWWPVSQEGGGFDSFRGKSVALRHDGQVFGATEPCNFCCSSCDVTDTLRVGKAAAGRLLDGREWSEFPGRNGVRA